MCLSKSSNIENYDGRITGVTEQVCGKICTETYGCYGFAYDKINSRCYLSQSPILFQPGQSIYTTEYEIDHSRCNKLYPIRPDIDNIDDIDEEDLRRNMLYSCQKNENDEYEFFKIANEEIFPINKTNTSNDTQANSFMGVKYEDYPVFKIDWPTYRKDLDIAKLYDKENNKLNNYMMFDKKNEYYGGEFLYPYKCVRNIPENMCIKTCSDREDCIGVEYNPKFIEKDNKISENVCCPLKSVSTINERPKIFENGYFYKKNQPNKLNKNNVYVKN
ncbi:hypothetical protein Catovirus_1_1095 [Catovirus CTV1]|uniref:Uncharacterized protein n=1 Tax=Catovirus CTV1 TaxID=1977631 RepID=A0A1V0SBF1_9VIRU|nr:hypothetical protein Catovirus_1_1095 [Catovirus CTV1]